MVGGAVGGGGDLQGDGPVHGLQGLLEVWILHERQGLVWGVPVAEQRGTQAGCAQSRQGAKVIYLRRLLCGRL